MQDKKSTIPIVFTHCLAQWPEYVCHSLFQTKRTNPRSRIYFITDNDPPTADVKFVPYAQFKESTDRFRSLYFHLSRQSFEIERLCIERWFVIRDLMHQENLERIFCMDTDVLLFGEVDYIGRRFADADYTLLNGLSWGTTFINNRKVLDLFCDMILKVYNRDPEIWPHVDARVGFSKPYTQMENLTDMALVGLFHDLYGKQFKVREQSEIIDGHLIDPNINISAPGVMMEGQFKRIELVDGHPYGRRTDNGELVKYDLLHFQGTYAKGIMKGVYDAFTPTWEKMRGEVNSGK